MPPTFLLRDDFTTTAAAPLASPRTAEPGPGTLTITDIGNKLTVANGKLTMVNAGAAGCTVTPGSIARAIGVSSVAQLRVTATRAYFQIDANNRFEPTQNVIVFDGIGITGPDLLGSTDYYLFWVARTNGYLLFVKGGVYINWTLYYLGASSSGSLSPIVGSINSNGAATFDTFRALQLPAPYTTDFGLATQRLAGARTAGDTFTHEANCVIEFTLTTRPSAANIAVRFREQDANNRWLIAIFSDGTIDLHEVNAGVDTTRGTVSAVVLSGHRVVVVADGSTIRVYSNNVLRITYLSATNAQTAIAGSLTTLGTGGAVSDIVSWPRQLSGQAALLLDAAVGGSGDLTATLADATLQATGQGPTGQLTATLASATLASTGQLAIAGSITANLAAATLASAGKLAIAGQLAVTLADTTTASSAKLAITAQMAAQLGAALLASAGRLSIRAQLSITLGAATLSAGDHPIAIELGVVYGQAGSGFVFGQQGSGEVIGI